VCVCVCVRALQTCRRPRPTNALTPALPMLGVDSTCTGGFRELSRRDRCSLHTCEFGDPDRLLCRACRGFRDYASYQLPGDEPRVGRDHGTLRPRDAHLQRPPTTRGRRRHNLPIRRRWGGGPRGPGGPAVGAGCSPRSAVMLTVSYRYVSCTCTALWCR
jgi:hypothetical protein